MPGMSSDVSTEVCLAPPRVEVAAAAAEASSAASAAAMATLRSTTLGQGSRASGEDARVHEERIRETLGRDPRELVWVEDGYDFLVALVDGERVFRFARRAQVVPALETEVALLPALARALPVAVPRFDVVSREPPFVSYPLLAGEPMREEDPQGVASFLSALHAFDPGGLPVDRPDWRPAFEEQCERFRGTVLPLLDVDERPRAERLLAGTEALAGFEPVLVHADLGPAHLRCRDGRLAGVIDWADARVGDPALDLAWPLHGHPRGEEILAAYAGRVDEGFRNRALFYHRLGPWFEADYGLVTGRPGRVASGLAGVRARLVSPRP
jgi:aminoglycoside phosphotransferase (APT) family kinase protein